MCGIAGVTNLVDLPPPDRSRLAAMLRPLLHRGPDGQGFYADEHCGLAHARLSIIDPHGGAQPIPNEDRTIWVVLNGEIFNYVELRSELQAQGHRFRTLSDTEVLVHLYERDGTRFIERLNGQFAIALWDRPHRRLLLARDRAGIRPLFHTRAAGRLCFASEIKALFALPEIPRALNREALGDVLTYWAPLAPDTAFEGIRSLPPGHMMTIEPGREQLTCYWDWHFPRETPNDRRPTQVHASELRELLADAVRLQMRADVPVGAYLSGGLDSSAIVALARGAAGPAMRTFSIGFEDPELDESSYQMQVARHLGIEHTRVLCRRSDIAEVFPRVIWHAETPIIRTAPAPLLILSRAVRDHGLKVVLTGEGADEVFGGYDIFKEAKIRRFWARRPDSRWRASLLGALYPYLRHSPAALRGLTREFYAQGLDRVHSPTFAHAPRWATTQRGWQFLSNAVRSELAAGRYEERILSRLPPEVREFLPMGRDQYVEAHTLLSGYLLPSQGDRVAMANSVEARYPFLDHRVIEYASGLRPSLKIRGLNEKHVLKRAVQELLPAEIVARTKQPYRAPDSQSFFIDGRPIDYVAELLGADRLRVSGYFDPVAVSKLVAKCGSGRAIGFSDNMAFVCILSTMLIEEMFLARPLATHEDVRSAEPEALAFEGAR
jgi:asparagine synthase (glutamine-hydrolysing)